MTRSTRTTRDDPHRSSAGFTIIEVLIVLTMIGILAAMVIASAYYAFDVSRLGRTVAEMRTVADAVMKYERDNGSLPPAGGLVTVASIEADLANNFKGSLPLRDGWGNALYYEPTVLGSGTPSFRLYSYGKDGTPDGAVTGVHVDFFTDIVVESGTFIQTKW